MDFRVLGPVEAESDGQRVDLGPRKQRFVLGVLLLDANRFVPMSRLIDLTWSGAAPPAARSAMHAYISRLRSALESAGAHRYGVSVATDGPGYVLHTDPMLVDAHRFRALVGQARQLDDDHRAVAVLREALALWRGPALAGEASGYAREQLCRGLEEARLAAVEDRVDAELRLGRHRMLLDELAELVGEHPLRERLTKQLMLALYRCGRAAEALEAYRRLRERLSEELGLDPGPQLRRLEVAILRDDPDLDPPPLRRTAEVPVPAQLPADVAAFTGREAELAALDRMLTERENGLRPTAFMAITGPAGVGKTGLAVHWAHTVAGRFPDGRVYVDLRGFGRDDPLDPAVALERILRALGVPAAKVLTDPEERAAQYRSLLATRRVLLVLDNAASSAQARPLLPGAGGNAAVITSRRRLDGLTVRDGVAQLPLAPLDDADATELIGRLAGVARALREPAATARLARLCDRLPLAVRIAAARLSAAPTRPISELVAELDDEQRRLPGLAVEDEETAVHAAFAVSYRGLDPQAARLFRLVGLHPGPEPSVAACAALCGLPEQQAVELVDQLASATLVEPVDNDRFTLHDLVRLYARERAVAEESDAQRDAALRRCLEWYVGAAGRADRALGQKRVRLTWDTPDTNSTNSTSSTDSTGGRSAGAAPLPTFDCAADALAFLDAQGHNLTAAMRAAAAGYPRLACRLADALYGWVDHRHHRAEWVEIYSLAAVAAGQLGDDAAEGLFLNGLAIGYCHLLRYDEAAVAYERALALRQRIGEVHPLAATMINLGALRAELGDDEQAVALLTEALALVEPDPGLRHVRASCLVNLGWVHHTAGRRDEAVAAYSGALAVSQEIDDRQAACYAAINLGEELRLTGRYDTALTNLTAALPMSRELGNRMLEAWALNGLGRTLADSGRGCEAREYLAAAAGIFEAMGDPKAELARSQLAELDAVQCREATPCRGAAGQHPRAQLPEGQPPQGQPPQGGRRRDGAAGASAAGH